MTEQAFYLHQHINDFDEFCANARNWDLDYRQLEAGNFNSELLMFGNARVLFSRAKLGRRLLQRGAAPQGLVTFGLLADPAISIFWRNIDVSGNHLFIFPPCGELQSISQADFDVFVVSLSEQKLDQLCAAFELAEFHQLLGQHEVFDCAPQMLNEMRQFLLQTERELSAGYSTIHNPQYLNLLEHELAGRLVRLLAGQILPLSRNAIRKRDLALQSAESYLYESSHRLVTIPELCEVCNVSQRTLEYAFRERYGMTPKAYSLAYRLNNVRKHLRAADPDEEKVSEIAQDHGFWHMGQFSVSYRRLFAELPSETLKQAR